MDNDESIKPLPEKGELQGSVMSSLEKNEEGFVQQRSESTMKQEMEVRKDLLEQGVETKIVNAIRGYTPDEIPFVYKQPEHEVYHQVTRSAVDSGLVKGTSELWIATSDVIYNLSNENGQRDQIPEVIAQWRKSNVNGKVSITRQEIKHIGKDEFVELEYRNVSAMGQLDGDLNSISYSTPDKPFNPYGGPERMSYKTSYISKEKEADVTGIPGSTPLIDEGRRKWKFGFGCSSTTILNGLQEMENLGGIGLIESVKYIPEKAYRFTKLPEPKEKIDQYLISPEEETWNELKGAIEKSKLERLIGLSYEFMKELYIRNKEDIFKNNVIKGGVEMEINGILNHPDKIWILDKYIDTVSPRTRYLLARALSIESNKEIFQKWANEKFMESPGLQTDMLIRNSRHLVLWFKRGNVSEDDIENRIGNCLTYIINEGDNKPSGNLHQVFENSLQGLSSSIVERYLEYLAQKYLGNFLE